MNPYWLTVRRPGTCRRCDRVIARGARAFWYPLGRFLLCAGDDCGGAASREYAATLFDERGY